MQDIITLINKMQVFAAFLIIIAKFLKRFNFNVVLKPVNKVKFPSTKSTVPDLRKWAIYKVPCNGCHLS